jgi:hypothetical protein
MRRRESVWSHLLSLAVTHAPSPLPFAAQDTESTTWEKPEELGWRRVTKDEL